MWNDACVHFDKPDRDLRFVAYVAWLFSGLRFMSEITATASASDIQMDYMKLLVTQLQNQNPLEPLDNQEMAAQLAQFSQLQQLENMNASFGRVLESVQRSYASSLLGKAISFHAMASDGTMETRMGRVDEVIMGSDGQDALLVEGQQVDLAAVLSVRG